MTTIALPVLTYVRAKMDPKNVVSKQTYTDSVEKQDLSQEKVACLKSCLQTCRSCTGKFSLLN